MRVLISVPRSDIPAAGPAYVAATLKQAGHSVTGHLFKSAEAFREVIRNGYDIMATGGLCSQFKEMKCMVDIAHQEGLKTIVGGGIVSSEPELMTRELGTDYSVLGQGEITAVELVNAIANNGDIALIKGLGYCRNGEFIETPCRPEIDKLDELPFPDYDAFGFSAYLDAMKPSDRDMLYLFDQPREYPLIASRSCPYKCSFCYHPSGYKYRRRSVDSIMAELQQIVPKYRINIISILDELFSADEKRLLEFCERFKAFQATVPWEIRWFCCLHVAGLKSRTLEVMRDAGCYMVSYGFESYSPVVLKSMQKHITPEEIHFAVHETLDRKLALQANFIFGDRAESRETAEQTLAFWRAHPEAGIFLGPMIVCPNSPDYQYCLAKGIIKDRVAHIRDHVFDTLNMTAMPDKDFFRLIGELFLFNITDIVWVPPLKRTPDSLVVQCPHCQQILTYKNYHTPRLYKHRMICRACHKRFFVSGRFFILLQKAVAAIAPRSAYSYYFYRGLRRLVGRMKELAGRIRSPA
jgi:radical SAM superfamily enzyme YgiQ (UPF0313 family)